MGNAAGTTLTDLWSAWRVRGHRGTPRPPYQEARRLSPSSVGAAAPVPRRDLLAPRPDGPSHRAVAEIPAAGGWRHHLGVSRPPRPVALLVAVSGAAVERFPPRSSPARRSPTALTDAGAVQRRRRHRSRASRRGSAHTAGSPVGAGATGGSSRRKCSPRWLRPGGYAGGAGSPPLNLCPAERSHPGGKLADFVRGIVGAAANVARRLGSSPPLEVAGREDAPGSPAHHRAPRRDGDLASHPGKPRPLAEGDPRDLGSPGAGSAASRSAW
jgi:hypothetical protein